MAARAQTTRLTADQALARLIEGNRRFLQGKVRTSAIRLESFADLAKGQQPFATILGCSDSRVPPEWVFDAGLGELFVIRIAGNVFAPEVAGSLQYAGSCLQTPLFVVMGHEGCGAVAAALAVRQKRMRFKSRIQVLVNSIVPGIPKFGLRVSQSERLAIAVESNVRRTVELIKDTPEGKARQAEGRMRIVGAVYEIESGRVRWLSD